MCLVAERAAAGAESLRDPWLHQACYQVRSLNSEVNHQHTVKVFISIPHLTKEQRLDMDNAVSIDTKVPQIQ